MGIHKVTILLNYGSQNDFSVLAADPYDKVKVQTGLTYDEMLGTIARLFCPTGGDGMPLRHIGKPLFLEPPPL